MRKLISLFLFCALSGSVFAQTQVINDFEDPQDSTFWGIASGDNATDTTKMELTFQTDNAVEGAAVSVDWRAEDSESYGGFVKFEHYAPDSMVYDWSAYDTVSFWYYNEIPQSAVGDVHVRFNLYEVSDVPDTTSSSNDMEFYYSFHYGILDDSTSAWHKISIPLIDGDYWNGEGFNRTGWAGVVGNDKLDADKIKGYTFEFSIGGGGDFSTSEGIVLFDQLELSGLAERPWLIFNGKTVNPDFTTFTWGQSTLEVVEGAGIDPATNALLWTQGDEWANGWSGAGWNVDPHQDLGYRWPVDSLKFALKAETGTNSPIRVQFESPNGAWGYPVEITADDQWHEYAIPLRDFYNTDGAKPEWDSTDISVVQMMGEGNATAGKKLWIDFMWTGNPAIDVVPPVAPTGVAAVQGTYQNLVTWIDVPNEDNSTYSVLASTNPITSLDDEGLETVARNIAPGTQLATHVLKAPLDDMELTYYYAVYATDAAGNEGELAKTDAVNNTAQGVATITPNFAGFTADGDLSEWSELPKFRMFPSDGSGTVVNNTVIDGDADLSLNAYVAMDNDYIYFAYDVEDDVVDVDTTKNSWMRDCPELYLGLYDWHGDSHTSLEKGTEPDLHFRFNSNQIIVDNWGGKILSRPTSDDYHWEPKFPTGYVVEGRISFDSLAAEDGVEGRFQPVVGMRIPFDIEVNDNDEPSNPDRQGQLTYSKNNDGLSYGDVSRWTYTWIGDQMVGVEENSMTINTYELGQNYPNPFNPSTVINYSLANSGMVSLKVFNVLGQEVLTLVDQNQNAGQYQIKFDASQLSSGVYIYRIQSGSFVSSRKMMLLK